MTSSSKKNNTNNVTKQDREVLPSNVRPRHYFVSYTSIDLDKDFKFEARVEIDLEVTANTDVIVLNSVDIEYLSIHVTQNENTQQIKVPSIKYEKKSEQASIPLTQPLVPGTDAKLVIEFVGELNDKMKGFYRSKYQNSKGDDCFCGVTQFEPTDARRAFPCWDEPAVKASFTVEMTFPKDLVCISNMPAMESKIVGDNNELRCVLFDRTPVMSTYLLAWIIGEFECVESRTNRDTIVRVWTKVGEKNKAEFALKVACRCLEWYEKYFQIEYPLPKCDMIAVPDFAAGAMENWGLITYREVALLCDEQKASISAKQYVCIVVCHELAHQWFGNLVTMDWWSQLWLNEGFACFMEYLSSDALYPQWRMWDLFLTREYSRAYELDGMTTSHPIEVHVPTAAQADEVFDAISYCKGACIIRMLQSYVGANDFRNALTKYLNHFAYKNAVTTDLWSFLARESGKAVGDIMQSWTSKQGFPLIQASRSGDSLTLTQSRYLSSGKPSAEQNQTVWNVPICMRVEGENEVQQILLDSRSKAFPIPSKSKWVHINAESTGFYCCQYDKELADALNNALVTGDAQLTVVDRVCLIRDTKALAESGVPGATVQLLNLFRALKNEKTYPVWSQAMSAMADVNHLLMGDEPVSGQLHAVIRDTLQPIFDDLGWEEKDNNNNEVTEDETRNGLFRPLILSAMNKYGNKEVIAETMKRFGAFMSDPKANDGVLAPAVRSMAFRTAVKNGDAEEYALVKNYYLQSTDPMEKSWSLRSLGCTQNEKLIAETLEWILKSDEVRKQDKVFPFRVIAGTKKGKMIAWQFLQKTWDEWYSMFDGGFLVQHLTKIPSGFATKEMGDEVEKFYGAMEDEAKKRIQRSVGQCIENIRQSANWRGNEIANIAKWAQENA